MEEFLASYGFWSLGILPAVWVLAHLLATPGTEIGVFGLKYTKRPTKAATASSEEQPGRSEKPLHPRAEKASPWIRRKWKRLPWEVRYITTIMVPVVVGSAIIVILLTTFTDISLFIREHKIAVVLGWVASGITANIFLSRHEIFYTREERQRLKRHR